MMKIRHLVLLPAVCVFAVSILAAQATDCSQYNTSPPLAIHVGNNTQEHTNGSHFWTDSPSGQCAYSGTAQYSGPVGCNVVATAQSTYAAADTGKLSTLIDSHFLSLAQAGGQASATNGGTATADTEGAFAVRSCAFACGTAITISGAGNGAGFSVTYNPTDPLWTDKWNATTNCNGVTLQQLTQNTSCPSPTSPYPPQSTQNGYFEWDDQSCTWVWVNCPSGINCVASPIVIDTLHKGFAFTDPTKGQYVTFDLKATGTPIKVSWTQSGSGNAWLAYDRDGDGVIKDGTELFGNFTPHSDFTNPNMNFKDRNGFLALGWYDQPAQGGNGDGIIDKNDAIWPKLRLWIDTHCYQTPDLPCQSLPSELHTLRSKGINSISLIYQYDPMNKDAIGNWFKLWAYVNPDISSAPLNADGKHEEPEHPGRTCCDLHTKSTKDGRKAYDVYLKVIP